MIFCTAALWGDRIATGHDGVENRVWSLGNGGSSAGVLRGFVEAGISLAVVGGCTAQQLLASGSVDHRVRLWDVDAGTCTAVLSGHAGAVFCLVDLGGRRLLSGSLDRSLRVWNTATGACLAVVQNAHGEGDRVWNTAACALPGGAVTGSWGGTVRRMWDEGAGALTPDGAALQLEGGLLWSLAAVPGPHGAQQLLAGCDDGTLRALGDGTGRELQQQAALAGHSSFVRAMAVMASMTE